MAVIEVTKANPTEIFRQLGTGNLQKAAHDAAMPLSAYLERIDPSRPYKDNTTAFQRLLMEANIVTNNVLEEGYYCDEFGEFTRDANTRALGLEWAIREFRKVSAQSSQQRAVYLSDDQVPGSISRPYFAAARARAAQIAPAIPISEVVAITTPIDSNVYKAFYLTDDATQARLVRVTETAEMPRAKLTGGERSINLYKYGRILEVSYETLRRMRINMVALHIARMAIQAEVDKVAAVMDVMINGDGNSGTSATSYNLTTLDAAAAAGTLSLKGWLAFKLKFANPYAITHILVQDAVGLQLQLLNVGSANIPLVAIAGASGFGGFTPINPELRDNVRLGITADAPALKIVGFDSRFGIERVVEVGADITETMRWITNQTNLLAMSEVEGYAVFDQRATKILDVNA